MFNASNALKEKGTIKPTDEMAGTIPKIINRNNPGIRKLLNGELSSCESISPMVLPEGSRINRGALRMAVRD
jgi:hypothetical protein